MLPTLGPLAGGGGGPGRPPCLVPPGSEGLEDVLMGGGGGASCEEELLFLGRGGGLDEGGGGTAPLDPPGGGGGGRGRPTILPGRLLVGGGGGSTDGGLTWGLPTPDCGLDPGLPPPGGGLEGGGGGTPRGIPPFIPLIPLSSDLGFKKFGGTGGGAECPGFLLCEGGFGGPEPGRNESLLLNSGLFVWGGGGGGPAFGRETLSLKSGLLVWGGGGGGPGRPPTSPFIVGLFCEGGGGGGPPVPHLEGPLEKLGLTDGPLDEGLFWVRGGGGGPPPVLEGPLGTGPFDSFVRCGIFTPPFVGFSLGIPPANKPPRPIGAPPPPMELPDSLSSWLRFHEFGMFLSWAPLLGRAATVLNLPPPPPEGMGMPPPPDGFLVFPTTGALLSLVTVFFNFAPV